jgi:hypothetical protein
MCPLGDVELLGSPDARDGGKLSGQLIVRAAGPVDDIDDWRNKVKQLCIHIRHVMSFAAGRWLPVPVEEHFQNNVATIEAYSASDSHARAPDSGFPVFSSLSLDAIFQRAVASHFAPPFQVHNLNFAIQWFCMRGAYREANLITAMTVLENLVDSNLPPADTSILSDKAFKTLRHALSEEIKRQAQGWSDDPALQRAYIDELCPRLTELKRRTLLDKMTRLARRWGVDLEGIAADDIQEAKRARDQVVHRGHYSPKPGATKDLHDHLLTIREVVVRFILAALGFEGNYQSYIGGQHTRSAKTTVTQPGIVAGAPAIATAPNEPAATK